MKRQVVPYRISFEAGEPDYWGHFNAGFKQTIHQVPIGAQWLSAEVQIDFMRFGFHPQIAVYFLVDPDEKSSMSHQFRVFSSGESFELEENEEFLRTVKLRDGEHMFHVFHRLLGAMTAD